MVELFDNLVMTCDGRQYVIKRRSGKDKDGEDLYVDHRYYSSLGNALNGVVDIASKKALKENDATLHEVAEIYNNAVKQLVELKKELKLMM